MTITRDQYGRPLITPPEGGKPVPYIRASGIGDILEESEALTKWKMRMVALGIAARDDLYALASTLTVDDKKDLDDLAREAMDAAGGGRRANLGTALHKLTELVDMGLKPKVQPALRADLDAYTETMNANGIEILPGWIERFVVCDEYQIGGTPDRFVRLADGAVVVADLKTGSDMTYTWRKALLQMAAYAHSVAYSDDGTRTPLPAGLDLSRALVIHLPFGEGRCELHTLPLAEGWEQVGVAMEVRAWRNRRNLNTPYDGKATMAAQAAGENCDDLSDWVAVPHTPTATNEQFAVTDSVDGWVAMPPAVITYRLDGVRLGNATFDAGTTTTTITDAERTAVAEITGTVDMHADELYELRRAHIRHLIDGYVKAGRGNEVVDVWPQGVRLGDATPDELDTLHALVTGLPFLDGYTPRDRVDLYPDMPTVEHPANIPHVDTAANITAAFPDAVDETPPPIPKARKQRGTSRRPKPPEPDDRPATDAEIAPLHGALAQLTDDQRKQINQWVADADLMGDPINLRTDPTTRKVRIAWTMHALTISGADNADIRDLIYGATDNEMSLVPTVDIGAALGALTVPETKRLNHLVRGLNNGELLISYPDYAAGRPVFSGLAWETQPADPLSTVDTLVTA